MLVLKYKHMQIIKHKYALLPLAALIIAMLLNIFMPSGALAAVGDPCGPSDPPQAGLVCGNCSSQGCIWTTNTGGTTIPTDGSDVKTCSDGSSGTGLQDNCIVKYVQILIDFLAAGAAIVAVGAIIFGGIQYMTGGDNPQALSAAKERITNAIIAFVAFLFLFAFLEWLIPGGVF